MSHTHSQPQRLAPGQRRLYPNLGIIDLIDLSLGPVPCGHPLCTSAPRARICACEKHKYKLNGQPRAVKDFARRGHLGFQDHGQKVWHKNVKLLAL